MLESIKDYIMKRKKQVVIISVILLLLFIYVMTRPRIIPIPGGQDYFMGGLEEYFVIINPPRGPWQVAFFSRLIENYDKTHPIEAPPPPEDSEYQISRYSRYFLAESDYFPRDIEFTGNSKPSDKFTDEYNARDLIAIIHATAPTIRYDITIILQTKEIIFWDISRTYEKENTDPTVNGLYNNIPEHMIPMHRKGYENVIGG